MGKITELSRGSLNGLRRQTNECLKNAYNKGYEDGKKEPREVKALNLEDTCEYQIGYKVGYEDGKKQAISEIPKIANNENEMYNRGYNTAIDDYNMMIEWWNNNSEDFGKFLFEVYGLADCQYKSISLLCDIICSWDMREVIDKFKKWQEQKKQAEEFKVGDIVKFNKKCHGYETKKNREFLVLHKFDNGIVTLLYDNGDTGAVDISLLDKTGRHIDETEQLLDKLKGDK